MVGEPLVVAAEEGQVDQRLAGELGLVVEDRIEQLPVQLVHGVVVLLEAERGAGVLGRDHRPGLGDDPLGDLAHLEDVRGERRGYGAVRVAQPCDLRDVPGEVAHALEVRAHPHRGDHDPQVGGDGLLAGQQIDRERVQLGAERVEVVVGGDDALGKVDVAVEQSGRGPGDRRAGQPGHLDELVGDLVEVVVERGTHTVEALRYSGRPLPSGASARFAAPDERWSPLW